MPESITLYTAKVCPYAQRAEIALAEAKAPFTRYEIDLQNKPEWYAPKVNPASKVPAIAYGGPAVPPDQPSPDSIKLAESLVLVEFIADLYPNAHLLPSDPVLRAKARFFIDGVSTKLVPAWHNFLQGKSPVEDFYKAVEYVQALLPAEGGFAVGEYSIADIAITPFLARARVSLINEFGAYPEGEGKQVWEALSSGQGRFARFGKYLADLLNRESFKATFDEAYITQRQKARFANLRSQK
ncbi:glutathione S-transferase C-terminal-like protein [Lentinus tigrinus ALCF2SS1-7]|uniref:Glutathione S-transferase C-terminal-like protein n=1 Tax=Lentinus tigrinus ALCF2SS1-6 TaxID=1328759 RepID=A0A5C2RRE9_9APHY|nr:glutathione S-transferase C-terminal-like protein [Lentinus tigrinus ALCF2SS1-6]RPD72649.1 glutathione S-transferase C-terminal-like protein [Lentinus tigrinus ALCF2SS1-7]